MTPQNLTQILEQHARWLRNEEDGARADLSFQDLSGLQLPYALFRRVKLAGANLSDADFTGSNFTEADLFAANLKGAILRQVNFQRADLRGAQFGAADLSQAILCDTDMRQGRLMQFGAQSS